MGARPNPDSERAPAKINLALHVVGRRADGYHDLETLVVFADIGDRLTIVDGDGGDTFALTGAFADAVPVGGGNLAVAALRAMRQMAPLPPLSLSLEKNLPVAAGMGGGSADAAAVVRLLARRAGIGPSDPALQRLAAGLGADVPMCLAGRPLIARGRGERLHLLPGMPALFAVLVNPGVAVPTPDVFGALARRDNPPLPDLPAAFDGADLAGWLARTRNDLEAPALRLAPAIGDVLAMLGGFEECRLARMTGSGATCFGLFPDAESARRAARLLARRRPDWWCRATLLSGSVETADAEGDGVQ